MVSALGLAGKASQQDKKKQHRNPQAGPAKEKKKQIDKKKRGVEGGKEKNPKVYCPLGCQFACDPCFSRGGTLGLDLCALLFRLA